MSNAQTTWPRATLDDVERLRVLARASRHRAYHECLIPAPFEAVWGIAGNLVDGAPRFETALRRVDVVEAEGERLRIEARALLGPAVGFDVVLRSGWCLMWSGPLEIGMAAAPGPAPGTTHFGHFEGIRGSGRFLAPLFGRKVRWELARLSRLARQDAGDG